VRDYTLVRREEKMRKSGDGDEFRGEIERDAHQGSNIEDALIRRAPQEGVREEEGADEGSRKRESSRSCIS